ncbi:hypothetical protein MTZ49_01505 [Entomomonas sp. E2T0]|uniref:phage tail tube protein n=1 Tax=Entomomonas sp. E2T0 TaxID=2930213 RepID=UPI00222843E8|nr:hypothetical protein [Entomomonas sp. E2T0]UYZ84284.1 hypothetical protein MTZ49_01505 [Entomomonas sp. E2T0]
MSLYSIQARVLFADRSPLGKPVNPVWVGNVPTFTLGLGTETTTHNESFSGKRLPYGRLTTSTDATLNVVFEELFAANLIQALYAKETKITAGTVTDEELPDNLKTGDIIKLDHTFLEGVVTITDSASTPATVTDAQVKVRSLAGGMLEVVDITGLQLPLKVSYSYTANSNFAIFGETPKEKYVILDGINTETQEPVIFNAYRCKFDPAEEFALINEEYGQLSLTGSLLYDELNVNDDGSLAGFADFQLKAA